MSFGSILVILGFQQFTQEQSAEAICEDHDWLLYLFPWGNLLPSGNTNAKEAMVLLIGSKLCWLLVDTFIPLISCEGLRTKENLSETY